MRFCAAAVLAIFMGGLGLGGAILGRRADQHPQPLVFYAQLELWIAGSAGVTPALMSLARQLYIALGGSVVLGLTGATVVRLILAALVLCVPTFLMGGTRPARLSACAWSCVLEAAGIAFPYALGDRVALLTLMLRPLGALEFFPLVLGVDGGRAGGRISGIVHCRHPVSVADRPARTRPGECWA